MKNLLILIQGINFNNLKKNIILKLSYLTQPSDIICIKDLISITN